MKKKPMPVKMGLFEKIKKVTFSPSQFFEKIKKERGIGSAFVYLAILSLIYLIFLIFITSIFHFPLDLRELPYEIQEITTLPTTIVVILIFVFFYVFGLAMSFVSAGIIHLLAKLLKGKGDYSATYKACIYGATPTYLLGWIPFVGWIPTLYSIYLTMKGISKLHTVSMIRAFVIVFVIPLILLFILLVGIFLLFFLAFSWHFIGMIEEILGIMVLDRYCTDGTVTFTIMNTGTQEITNVTCIQRAPPGDNIGNCTTTPQTVFISIPPRATRTFTDICSGTGVRDCVYTIIPPIGIPQEVEVVCGE